MENPGSSAHLPKRAGCMPWFFQMSAGTLNYAMIIAVPIVKKIIIKNGNFAFLRATFSREKFPQMLLKGGGAREMEIFK